MANFTSSKTILDELDQTFKKDFERNKRVLTFDEYLNLVHENPESQMRGSAKYLVDLFDYYGKTETAKQGVYRFKVFDEPVDGIAPMLVGHEEVQSSVYNELKTFVAQKNNEHLILLHGPNGSAKTTFAHAIMNAMERFSRLSEGAVYSFNWIFPHEKISKGTIGFDSKSKRDDSLESYAHLSDEDIAARIPCDIKDHPLLLLPKKDRAVVLEKLLGKERFELLWKTAPNYLREGELGHRNKMIFEALLVAYSGDYKKVIRHIQVERFYFERRYRKGLVTIEPQMHVDAHFSLLTMNRSISALPSSLTNLNLFSLSGDLIDGNRGLIEYSDLLKRPLDSFKYLLTACETGSVNVGSSIASLDTVFIGSTNELQLDAFKEFPDFSSFKARIHLIQVPYLLRVQDEEKLYTLMLPRIAGEKPISPHVARVAATWAVLTRLKKANASHYPSAIGQIIGNLSPMAKAKIYDKEEFPAGVSAEEKKILKASLVYLQSEFDNVPFYEGRTGASVREMKAILSEAAQNSNFPCLSPLSFFAELEKFVQRVSEYEFLKQDVKDGYHDAYEFINIATNEYLDIIDREVKSSISQYDSNQWEEFIKKYVNQISHLLKKEKIKNSITGQLQDPDLSLIQNFETIVAAPTQNEVLEAFRRNILTQLGAWSLDHPREPVVYAKAFPEYWNQLEKHFFDTQKNLLVKMYDAITLGDHPNSKMHAPQEGEKLANETIATMVKRYGYTVDGAKEVIIFLMKKRGN